MTSSAAGTTATTSKRPRVLIVGGGFAGLNAAEVLGGMAVDVTLVDRRNHHTFQPLLYQVAMGVLSPADIAQPIRTVLRHRKNVEVLMDEVVGIDAAHNTVQLRSNSSLPYDYLILATGSTHSYFGHNDWAVLAPGLKTVEDATEMRRRIMLAYELAEREAAETGHHPPLNFVIVGGGPTGVELAGAIRDIASYFMGGDFRHIHTENTRVLLVEGGPHILPSYPEDLQAKAVEQLKQLKVEIITGQTVTDIQPGYVTIGKEPNQQKVESLVTLWAAGVQASPLGRMLGTPVNKRGSVIVDATLNPPGLPNVFVCGDLADATENGKHVPGVAQPAMQMGAQAAHMIQADIDGRPRKPFHYFDKGDMATIGRARAVADVKWPFKAHWGGFMAWLSWLVVHIYFLIGFRNRISVLMQWGWTYLTQGHGARLITGNQKLPGWEVLVPERQGANQKPLDLASPMMVDPPMPAMPAASHEDHAAAAQQDHAAAAQQNPATSAMPSRPEPAKASA